MRPISASVACTRTCRKLIDDIEAFCGPFLHVCDDLEELLTDNRIFKQRNVDIGVVKLADAWAWGFSGVMVRGSGAAWDLRKAQPYECYAELDFDIPVGKNGDCYDRYCSAWRRCASRSASCASASIGCARRKGGSGQLADHKIVPPRRAEMKRSMEALIHHFKLYTEGFHVPAGEVYAAVEAPKGEFGVYLVADGTNKPYRCKIRAPGFRTCGDGFMTAATCWPMFRRSWARSTSCSARSTVSVRRLAKEQPASFVFAPETSKAKARSPSTRRAARQSAVIPILWLI